MIQRQVGSCCLEDCIPEHIVNYRFLQLVFYQHTNILRPLSQRNELIAGLHVPEMLGQLTHCQPHARIDAHSKAALTDGQYHGPKINTGSAMHC